VSVHGWVARLVAICVIYILLYLLAGAFIALRDPALQAFYDQIGMPSLGTIFGVQALRGALWAAAGALLLGVLDANRRTAAGLVGLVFTLPVTLLLIPNPIMPPEVRSTHFVEVASSNFLFGLATAWILTRRARGSSLAQSRAPAPAVTEQADPSEDPLTRRSLRAHGRTIQVAGSASLRRTLLPVPIRTAGIRVSARR